MKSVYLHGFESEDGVKKLLKISSLKEIESLTDADVIIYKGVLEELLRKSKGKLKAQKVIPYNMFLMNNGVDPIDLSDQVELAEYDFENEDIRGVSEKISDLVEHIDHEEHFSDLGRYLKLAALELTQNALIYKRMSGKDGKIELRIFETGAFYNLCVTDPFGALNHEEILEKLTRVSIEKTYENKESGAGLGLFMVLNSSDYMIFELNPSNQTRVCCIINKYKRLKEFKTKSPALFVFKE